MMTQVNTTQQS